MSDFDWWGPGPQGPARYVVNYESLKKTFFELPTSNLVGPYHVIRHFWKWVNGLADFIIFRPLAEFFSISMGDV